MGPGHFICLQLALSRWGDYFQRFLECLYYFVLTGIDDCNEIILTLVSSVMMRVLYWQQRRDLHLDSTQYSSFRLL
jgi:hypothetical protein